jgi:hypothetical protein
MSDSPAPIDPTVLWCFALTAILLCIVWTSDLTNVELLVTRPVTFCKRLPMSWLYILVLQMTFIVLCLYDTTTNHMNVVQGIYLLCISCIFIVLSLLGMTPMYAPLAVLCIIYGLLFLLLKPTLEKETSIRKKKKIENK